MVDQKRPAYPQGPVETQSEGLRQALLRLTSPRYEALQEEIAGLRQKLDSLNERHVELTKDIRAQFAGLDSNVTKRQEELSGQIEALQLGLRDLEAALREEEQLFREELNRELSKVKNDLVEPEKIAERMKPVLVPVMSERIRQDQDEFAEAVGPVIGPAIRHQIRESKQDIIDSLYPIIGQIIGKAIAESIRELTRNIDARLRQQLNFRTRLGRLMARIRGVSEAEMVLREALPFSIERVFLIHRPSGILLTHLLAEGEEDEEMDTISGMLTAIRDFVRDSFGQGEGDLEEVTHGDRRILLEGGQYAYVAVVLRGVEPSGYSQLIRDVIGEINLDGEKALRDFDGDMERLPNFRNSLKPLLFPELEAYPSLGTSQPLSRRQKWLIGLGIGGGLLLLALIAFVCIFTVRLWPLAFSGLSSDPSATSTSIPLLTATSTQTASLTLTLPPSSTPSPTSTPIPSYPTATQTSPPQPTASPTPITGVLQGNLKVRSGHSQSYQVLGVILSGEKVRIHQWQEGWVYISWPVEGETRLEGWLWGERYLTAGD